MLRFMLDTDTASYIIKAVRPTIDRRVLTMDPNELCISVITQGELLFGVAKAQHPQSLATKVKDYLRYTQVLELTSEVCNGYGDIRADLKKRGLPIGSNDTWIAAHARHLGLTLVTNNTREFSRVSGLEIENWAE